MTSSRTGVPGFDPPEDARDRDLADHPSAGRILHTTDKSPDSSGDGPDSAGEGDNWPSPNLLALGEELHAELRRAGYAEPEPTWSQMTLEERVSCLVIAKTIARKYEALYGAPGATDL